MILGLLFSASRMGIVSLLLSFSVIIDSLREGSWREEIFEEIGLDVRPGLALGSLDWTGRSDQPFLWDLRRFCDSDG